MAVAPHFRRIGCNPNGKTALMNKDRIEGSAKQAAGKIKEGGDVDIAQPENPADVPASDNLQLDLHPTITHSKTA